VVAVAGAWPAVVDRLTGLAKALFREGRVIEVAGGAAVVALPNEVHRQKCEASRAALESALADQLGGAVGVRLVVADVTAPPASTASRVTAASSGPAGDDEEIDLDALVDAPSAPAARGADKLVEAFPGAELIEDDQ
jgi:hypothetical protein